MGGSAGPAFMASQAGDRHYSWHKWAFPLLSLTGFGYHYLQRAGDVIVDVRTPEEYATGHVAGAVNVPIGTLPAALALVVPTGQVITICGMGGRASKAAALLDTAGRAAFWLDSGTKAWAAPGFDVVRGLSPR